MEKKVIRTTDTLFYNSQCLFIEYHDVLNIPWLVLLTVAKQSKSIQKLFDLKEIEHYDMSALLEWYKYRNSRNIFNEFNMSQEINTDDFLKAMMTSGNSDYFHSLDFELIFNNALKILMESRLVKKILIYSEYEESGIRDYISKRFSSEMIGYTFGDLNQCLKSIPIDSTYVFSDICKVNNLIDTNHLSYSSIIIANNYKYNYDDDKKLKVDLDKLSEDYVFKYGYFNAFQNPA